MSEKSYGFSIFFRSKVENISLKENLHVQIYKFKNAEGLHVLEISNDDFEKSVYDEQ